jgi:hypothetical protein
MDGKWMAKAVVSTLNQRSFCIAQICRGLPGSKTVISAVV